MYLKCKAKKFFFCIACLGKKLVFHTEISTYSLILSNSKNIEILSDQGVVQIEPNLVWSIPCVFKV